MAEEKKADGLKDRDLQKYYEAMLAMFASPGWTYLMEDLAKIHTTANTLSGIGTMEDLHFRRGQIDILEKVAAQPHVVDAAYDQLLLAEDV